MLEVIISMLSKVVSTKKAIAKLQEAINLFSVATTEEEKETAGIKLFAYMTLVMEKLMDSHIAQESGDKVIDELKGVLDEIKSSDDDEEELITELRAKNPNEALSGLLGLLGMIDQMDEEPSLAITHKHDYDTCKGKGQCPIEDIMRAVNKNEITIEEGNLKAKERMEENTIQMAENPVPPSFVTAEA